jgi:hypothetical protein
VDLFGRPQVLALDDPHRTVLHEDCDKSFAMVEAQGELTSDHLFESARIDSQRDYVFSAFLPE